MKLALTQTVWLGFGLALALLLAVVVIAVRNQRAFVAGTESVRHSYEVIDELEDIPALMTVAESSRRGFILTRDERLLAPFGPALAELPRKLQAVRRLTADNPGQQKRLDQIELVVGRKLEQLRASLARRRQGGDDAERQRALTLAGAPLAETIHALCEEAEAEERTLLGERAARSAAQGRAVTVFVILSGALGILTVGLAGREVRRDVAERDQARTELRGLNATLEQRVAARTVELQAANKELEAFSYSVSHDLRAPLRAIDGFSKILITDGAAGLSAGTRETLELVRANTRQMGRLIDDLLNFARLGRQPLKKETVPPAALVNAALAELCAVRENQAGEIVVGELPPAQADPALLRVVWVNLLSNALKYSRKHAAPRIEIGAVPGGAVTRGAAGGTEDGQDVSSRATLIAAPVYFVRDNGVGFKMAYADKLFGVFQRLHRAEDYEGTGLGLATAQRIIHRHGGRIWAEAEPDQGATFYFTLEPAKPAAAAPASPEGVIG